MLFCKSLTLKSLYNAFTVLNARNFCESVSLLHTTVKSFSEKEVSAAREWLNTFSSEHVPPYIFDISYSRASGPGGQKVNKTSSKATVSLSAEEWLNPQVCFWIPGPVRAQLQEKGIRYQTKSGGILIQSDSSRSRDTNTRECFSKLAHEIKKAVSFPNETNEEDLRKWDEVKQDQREKRLFHKKRNSDKKKSRSKKFDL